MSTQRFRSRYPQGSLVSELLQLEQGKYIVRVTIKLENVVLGTGLASAETVEAAEDCARQRALDLLILNDRNAESNGKQCDRDSEANGVVADTSPPPTKEQSTPIPKANEQVDVDFSEILAQTNIELRRLKWTQDEGRKHLLERYGKRSRQLLNDVEFLDFLEYLKSQATP